MIDKIPVSGRNFLTRFWGAHNSISPCHNKGYAFISPPGSETSKDCLNPAFDPKKSGHKGN